MRWRVVCFAAALAAATAFGVLSAAAQQYPSGSIRIIASFGAGTSGDLMIRLVGERLSEKLKQAVIIENRPGGAGIPANQFVAAAQPNGYTLLMSAMSLVTNAGLYESLPYDPIKDFAPIGVIGSVPLVMIAHPKAGFSSVAELIARAKANPKTLNFASSGTGTGGHLATELFMRMTGAELVHVPYRGGNPALTDLLAGHVQGFITGVPPVLEFINRKELLPIIVTSAERLTTLPDTPTGKDVGLPDYTVDIWFGLLAPAGTPSAVTQLLSKEIAEIIRDPAINAKFAAQGAIPVGSTPEQFAAIIRRDLDRWPPIMRAAGIKPQ